MREGGLQQAWVLWHAEADCPVPDMDKHGMGYNQKGPGDLPWLGSGSQLSSHAAALPSTSFLNVTNLEAQ